MGLFNWMTKNLNVAGVIAKKVHEEFTKMKHYNPDLTEADASKAIFMARGLSQNYGRHERLRYNYYIERDFIPDTLYSLSLAIVNVELNISMRDGSAFHSAEKSIFITLTDLGYYIPQIFRLLYAGKSSQEARRDQ